MKIGFKESDSTKTTGKIRKLINPNELRRVLDKF